MRSMHREMRRQMQFRVKQAACQAEQRAAASTQGGSSKRANRHRTPPFVVPDQHHPSMWVGWTQYCIPTTALGLLWAHAYALWRRR